MVYSEVLIISGKFKLIMQEKTKTFLVEVRQLSLLIFVIILLFWWQIWYLKKFYCMRIKFVFCSMKRKLLFVRWGGGYNVYHKSCFCFCHSDQFVLCTQKCWGCVVEFSLFFLNLTKNLMPAFSRFTKSKALFVEFF